MEDGAILHPLSSVLITLSLVNMHMLVVVIGPVLVSMAMRRASRRQFLGCMAMRAQVVRMIMAKPARAWHVVRHQQALAVVPAAFVDIEILLALGRALFLA